MSTSTTGHEWDGIKELNTPLPRWWVITFYLTIVWAIGYRPDYRWIEASAFDGAGRPMQNRGVTGVEGLTFIGLPWMHTWGSGRFLGIDRDAKHIATTIIDDLHHQSAPRLAVAR